MSDYRPLGAELEHLSKELARMAEYAEGNHKTLTQSMEQDQVVKRLEAERRVEALERELASLREQLSSSRAMRQGQFEMLRGVRIALRGQGRDLVQRAYEVWNKAYGDV